MADPLSITASVIAVSTLAAQLTKFIAHALHASDEVDAFKSELEDLQVVATRMRLLYEEQWTPEHQASVDQIKRILDHELEPQLRVLDAYLSKQFSNISCPAQESCYRATNFTLAQDSNGGAFEHGYCFFHSTH
jgi:hypothetical protein